MTRKVLHTRLCDLLGIEYPIIQAAMGTVAGPTLVAAVSNAGGLGILGVAVRVDDKMMREWIKRTKDMTDKPFGVGIALGPLVDKLPNQAELELAKIPAEYRAYAGKLKDEISCPKDMPEHPYMMGRDVGIRRLEIALEEGVPVIESAMGAVGWAVDMAHKEGAKFLAMVGNTRHAVKCKEAGVDVIIPQAVEAGGHPGRISGFVLTPAVVDAVSPTLVVHAGAVCDGRSLIAALALGADGVLMGTRFLATYEGLVDHERDLGLYTEQGVAMYRQTIIDNGPEDTSLSEYYDGKAARGVWPAWLLKWEKEGPPPLPLGMQGKLTIELDIGGQLGGKVENMRGMMGEVIGRIDEIKSTGQIVEGMIDEAVEILNKTLPGRITTLVSSSH